MRLSRVLFTTVPMLCVLAADMLCKDIAKRNLVQGESQNFIPGILRFTLTGNTGIAFGIGSGHAQVATIVGTIIFAAIVFWIITKEKSAEPLSRLELSGAGCILGGALGNILDRTLNGHVTDFLEFAFISFPVFNVADVMIDVGAGLIIIASLCSTRTKRTDVDSVGPT